MKKTFTKWILTLDASNSLVITPREVSRFAPINRVLDEVGFYSIEGITIKGTTYIVVYDPKEPSKVKSKILVQKTFRNKDAEGLCDMEESDRNNMPAIAAQYLKNTDKLVQ